LFENLLSFNLAMLRLQIVAEQFVHLLTSNAKLAMVS